MAPQPHMAPPHMTPQQHMAPPQMTPQQQMTPPPHMAPHLPPPAGVAGDPDMLIGQELCGYVIRRKLAEGGMGVVYEGVHSKIGRLGAIKLLKPELCRSEDVVQRFHQEALAVNSIRHENIVDIYDFGRDPYGRVFFVMEYLEGEPLSARIRRGALTWSEAFPILDQTLRALKAAHDKGFIHRDLKPDNLWLRQVEGRVQVKLLDFGIAKLVGSEGPQDHLTRTGSVIGTPHYMSPEQINGSRAIDQRTDLYALGVITYEMFAGITPFRGDTLQAIMTGHLFHQPPRLADIPAQLGVPGPIAEIVDRMLVKDAAGRYDSAADVLADLHDVHHNQRPAIATTLSHTRPMTAPSTSGSGSSSGLGAGAAGASAASQRPATGRSGALVYAGLALAVIAVAGAAIWRSQQGPAATPTPPAPATAATAAPRAPEPAATPPRPPAERPLDYDAVRKDAQTTLRAALRVTEPAVRIQGADTLGKLKDQPSLPPLTELTETDADLEVRGHAADAVGAIGAASIAGAGSRAGAPPASSVAPRLARLEAAAPPPLKVWYASALARLGDHSAARRLLGYARNKDLAVSLKAGMTLAEISPPGDRGTIAALRALLAHEAELNERVPYAGAVILSRLAALRDPAARKLLYSILDHQDEGARLAAAEGLARLGDDAGRKVLHDVFANQASPNRLVAAVAQIPLGEYGGFDLISAELDGKLPANRQLAARALGEIGERKSLPALIALAGGADWQVRIAAAAAIVAIVGLDPLVLAQASVDWTRGALDSQDWAVRRAAAGVLADIPAKDAVPLLAQAIADKDPSVRREASRSAGKMKTSAAAAQVATAVAAETDPAVKEQQIRALGEIGAIGGPASHDALARLTDDPGRLGVIASGSLIAIGDLSGLARLDAAVAAPTEDLRLAAVQAATVANNPIVVPTLVHGVSDKVFGVRFAAALGLAMLNVEKPRAVPVLVAALADRDPDVIGRALAALTRLGEKIQAAAPTPATLLDASDPRLRLSALPIVRALPASEQVPLLRRLIADPDPEVRRAGVDAIEDLAAHDKDAAIKLYRLVVGDDDPVVRSKASGQLSRLVPPPVQTAAAPVAPPPAADPGPPPDDALAKIKLALDGTTATTAETKAASEALEAAAAELATRMAAPATDDAATKRVEDLSIRMGESAARLEAVADKLEAAARTAGDLAGASPAPDAARLVEQARTLAGAARATATTARSRTADAADKARKYVKVETGDAQLFIAAADAAIAAGNFADARINLDRAGKLMRGAGRSASLDYSYAQLYDRQAARTRDLDIKRKLLLQARESFQRFATGGTGPRVQRARDRLTEIAEELKELGAP
ncbi:MAG TPA: HEAT repeat domain-containing protein [Kofleriaceae bacterium]|nr:HEAT repeat domain-containing protein [Kofleriaceae bacterium]